MQNKKKKINKTERVLNIQDYMPAGLIDSSVCIQNIIFFAFLLCARVIQSIFTINI